MTRPRKAAVSRSRFVGLSGWSAIALAAAIPLALGGCDDEPDLPEDPPLAVPGHETLPDAPQMPPGMTAAMANPSAEEPDPPLAVPGYETLPDPPPPPMPQGMPPGAQGMVPGQMPEGGQVPPGAGGPTPQGPIQLTPGFQPDPLVARGVAGGPLAAAGMSPECLGYIGQQPSHVVQLAAGFQTLRVIVSSQQDTTLVIRGPQGEFRCNDDRDLEGGDVNPLVEGAFGPGAYSVWVGSYEQGVQAPYAIGFSEIPTITSQHVAQAAQQLPAPPQPGMQPQQPMQPQ